MPFKQICFLSITSFHTHLLITFDKLYVKKPAKKISHLSHLCFSVCGFIHQTADFKFPVAQRSKMLFVKLSKCGT